MVLPCRSGTSRTTLRTAIPSVCRVLGTTAYLAAWGGQTCSCNGVHVVDISDLDDPGETAFIQAKEGSYPGEGVQALNVSAPAFTGDIS